ncbi:hypothetical protein [Patulibacter sp. SYSU D01012]|nr:hypothetical protein [Patulibacter sp. SYSU D01012]
MRPLTAPAPAAPSPLPGSRVPSTGLGAMVVFDPRLLALRPSDVPASARA